MSDEKAALKKLVRNFREIACGDAKAQSRVKAVNTLLNSGHNLKLLEDGEIIEVWDSIFFALWFSEMGRGCEEIIAAVERACSSSYKLTRVGFQTIAAKWYGLDQHRVDKISHLARHLLPVLINHQIALWLNTCKKSKKLGTRDIYCRKLLKITFNDVIKSFGLCYFLLEILAEEISKTLKIIYNRLNIYVGKFELKANLIVFLYEQVISFACDIKLDARLLRTFDQYVFKKFIEDILPDESQLTQILVSLRLHQSMANRAELSKARLSTAKCRALMKRWSIIIKEIHENCINGNYFPTTSLPVKDTIHMAPHLKSKD